MKKTIVSNSKYNILLPGGLAIIFIVLLVHMFFGMYISGIITFGIAFFFCLFLTALNFQTMTLTNDGFVIKSFFVKIANASWDQIAKIDLLELRTYESRGAPAYARWIVLYTDTTQKIEGGGPVGKSPPWCVWATAKNIQTIKEFAPPEIVIF